MFTICSTLCVANKQLFQGIARGHWGWRRYSIYRAYRKLGKFDVNLPHAQNLVFFQENIVN